LHQRYIDHWQNKPIPQDKRYIITESGVLMAFHLLGPSATQYFDSGCVTDGTDGNGTPVSQYVKLFSGYKVE
jgi:hypothetical protein